MVAWAIGIPEFLILAMSGGLMGLPPGERDSAFVQCPPTKAIIYAEWSSRGAGREGAQGLDGLAADPEIREFFAAIKDAILSLVEKQAEGGGPPARTAARTIPPLVLSLLQRPGCLYASFDANKMAEVMANARQGADRIDPAAAALFAVQATLIIGAQNDAGALEKQISTLLNLAPAGGNARGDKLNRRQLPLPIPGAAVYFHRHKDYLIVSFGEGTLDGAIDGLNGESQGLLANESFQAAMKQASVARVGSLAWVDLGEAMAKATQALGPQGAMIQAMAAPLGLDSLKSILTVTGVNDDGQRATQSIAETGGSTKGVLSLVGGRGLTAADFRHVPEDADFVMALSVNPAKVLSEVGNMVGSIDPRSKDFFDGTIAQVESALGVKFDDLFAALDDGWIVYDAPSNGGFLLSSPVLSIGLKDHAKAEEVVSRLLALLGDSLPGEYGGNRYRRRGVFLSTGEFMKHQISFINTVGDDVPIAPAVCLTKTHLLVALHPQAIKAHIRSSNSGESFNVRPLLAGGGDVISLTHFDVRKLADVLYGITPYFAQMAYGELQGEGLELNIFSFPSARGFLPYVDDFQQTVRRTNTGIVARTTGGLPVPFGASLSSVLPWLTIGVSRAQAVPPQIDVRGPKKPIPTTAP